MLEFIRKYRDKTSSILSGFDRIVFRGLLRSLVYPEGMRKHLSRRDVPRRLFGAHAEQTTKILKEASLAQAERLHRPVIYLASSQTRKETIAKKVLAEDPVDSGLLCVLSCVEPCMTYDMYRNRDAKQLELVYRLRKCLHLYHYYIDPCFGLMHARIQTWYPFHVQVCMNGREWLARRMDQEGCGYTRYENSFPHLEDPGRAQQWLDTLVRLNWTETLHEIAARLNPAHEQLLGPYARYYWTAHQTEWATDIVFTSAQDLQRIYAPLVRGAITAFSTRHVMRFLGKQFQSHFAGEVDSHYHERCEGLSIKHNVNRNSVKMYDKGGRILRVETTINNPGDITVYRRQEGEDSKTLARRALRKGVADIQRRTQVSQRANERYLDALSQFDTTASLAQLLTPITKRVKRNGTSWRGLRPWAASDTALLQSINHPEFFIAGFRNADLSAWLYPKDQTDLRTKRAASGRVSYRLRLLRAHGLIAKIPRTRQYRITSKGRQLCTAILLAQNATIQQLNPNAA